MDITLTDVVDKLIGSYQAYGETNHDTQSLNNLETIENLIYPIIATLCNNVRKGAECQANSVMQVDKKSNQILLGVKEDIDDLLYDLNVVYKNTNK